MSVEVLDVQEAEPASRPSPPAGLSEAAAALDLDALWSRLEAWCAWRWGERQAVWIVEGPGRFEPSLRPATVDQVEMWGDGLWEATTLLALPLGLEVPHGTYRLTATVGDPGDVPADVQEALRRLAEYTADQSHAGRVATSSSRRVGDITVSSERPAAWQARALHYSGAADLLRRYR